MKRKGLFHKRLQWSWYYNTPYRDHKLDETPSDMIKYLRKAADVRFGYAEYEYTKYLKEMRLRRKQSRRSTNYLNAQTIHHWRSGQPSKFA